MSEAIKAMPKAAASLRLWMASAINAKLPANTPPIICATVNRTLTEMAMIKRRSPPNADASP